MQYMVMMDKLSEMLVSEQGGMELCRVAAERSTDQGRKRRLEEEARHAAQHRQVVAQLIQQLGGDPNYVSPTARMAQYKTAKLLESAMVVDGLSQQEMEYNDLENVYLAATHTHAEWELLNRSAKQMGGPGVVQVIQSAVADMVGKGAGPMDMAKMQQAMDKAVRQVLPEEEAAVNWARDTLSEMSLKMMMEGPAPPPERATQFMSGPFPPIDQIHPNPIKQGLMPLASEPTWIESTVVRAMKSM